MSYNNPVVQEVICELHLLNPLESAMQFKIVDSFIEDYQEIEIDPVLPDAAEQSFATRFRLWKNSRNELLQIFHNKIVINYIPKNGGKYLGWRCFLRMILNVYEKIMSIDTNLKISYINVCYIDNISVTSDTFTLGQYINCDGKIFASFFSNTNLPTDIIYGNGNIKSNKRNTQIKLNLKVKENQYIIVLNTQILYALDDSMNLVDALNKAHIDCVDLFENIVTEKVKQEIMGGTK